jgi:L-threonylcarbamoyladenylate synthase
VGDGLVDEVVRALEGGGVVVLPTDTVYGFVARGADPEATAALFALKGRGEGVPLAVLCASADQVLGIAVPAEPAAVAAVAARWWPGPLTLVLPRRAGADLHLGEPATTVGVRVPADDRLRAVARRVGPLAASSANRHGEPVVGTAQEATAAFGGEVALVVDGGPLGDRSSTVVDATGWPWVVLREGPIDGDEICAVAAAAVGAAG